MSGGVGASAAGFAAVLDAGGEPLARALEATERRLVEVAAGHGERLGALAGSTLAAGGKRLRPILVFLSAGPCAGERSLPAAVAVELLHMATLVHDDVLDRASLRRGHPTVFASDGRGAATATGDLLFSRAFAELVDAGDEAAVRELSRASSALARGELMQRDDAWAPDVAEERYLARCELKTGRLFEACCRLGAIFGSPGAAAAGALGAFGSRVGLAFQIFDDVLDVAGPAERTGKRRGTDLLDGTVTLPLILARASDGELARLDLREAAAAPEGAELLCDMIAATGALEQSRERALAHVAAAKSALAGVPLSPGSRRALELVAEGVVARYA